MNLAKIDILRIGGSLFFEIKVPKLEIKGVREFFQE